MILDLVVQRLSTTILIGPRSGFTQETLRGNHPGGPPEQLPFREKRKGSGTLSRTETVPDPFRFLGRARVEAIKALGVFNDEMYFREVYQPVLAALGITRPELRRAA